MDLELESELKSLRKKLYTYHNRILEIQRQSRLSRDEYEVRFKRRKMDNVLETEVFAFDSHTPLNNEYILEMISNYLPSQDLKSSRLVCRLWNREMARALAARQTLIVTENDCPEATSFIQNAKRSSVVALGNICFFDIQADCPLFKKLMSAFGWTLSGLKLEECKLDLENFASILTKQAPHLESFSYKDRALQESQRVSTLIRIKDHINNHQLQLAELKRLHWDEEFGRVELADIISLCPNLIELVYKNTAIPSLSRYTKLRWDSLRTLKFSPRDELRDEHVLAMASLKLKLRRLTMFGVNPSEKDRMTNLNKFFKSISSTLEDLELFQHYTIEYRHNPAYESPLFVSLPQLTRLNVDFCILKSAKVINHLPELRSLQCKSRFCEDWEAVAKNGFADENLKLTYLSLGSIDTKYLKKFTHSFKMCSNLELDPDQINDHAMRVIINGFQSLQQLKISKLGRTSKLLLTDSGLSGLNISTCRKIRKNTGMCQDELSKQMKFPAIHHLKDLIRLEIQADTSLLTDISVIYGIAKCSKLTILGLPKCDISDISLKAIMENLNLTLLDLPLSQCPKITESAINTLRNTHKDLILQCGLIGYPTRSIS